MEFHSLTHTPMTGKTSVICLSSHPKEVKSNIPKKRQNPFKYLSEAATNKTNRFEIKLQRIHTRHTDQTKRKTPQKMWPQFPVPWSLLDLLYRRWRGPPAPLHAASGVDSQEECQEHHGHTQATHHRDGVAVQEAGEQDGDGLA